MAFSVPYKPFSGSCARPNRSSNLSMCKPARLRASSVGTAAHKSTKAIYVVQNVFEVKADCFEAFEEVWRTRESHLKEMPGFVRFAMLKCENQPGKYISQTTWDSKDAFINWTQSNQFMASHGEKDSKRPSVGTMLEGPPSPQMFSSVTITE